MRVRGIVAAVLSCGALLAMAGCDSTATTRPTAARGTALDRAIVLLEVESRSKDPDIRANCVEALQPLREGRALDVISQGLHDDDGLVRYASAMAAGHRKALTLKPVLQSMAVTDTSENVQVAAIYALARIGDTKNMGRLAETLSSKDPSVRANTALALGLLGDKSAIPLLLSHAREAETMPKLEIAAALARLGDPSGMATLVGYTESRYFEDRVFAMAVWPDVADPRQADVLLSGLQDPTPFNTRRTEQTQMMWARLALTAARGLGKMGNREGLKGAKTLADDTSPEIRAMAALALGDILNPSEEHILARMMNDEDEHVRVAAAAAVIELNTKPGGAATE